MNLKFTYSISSELERIAYTQKNKNKYAKYGYKIYLPKGMGIKDELADFNEIVIKEMQSSEVDNVRNELEKNWKTYNLEILEQFSYIDKYFKEIEIVLTKYGVGGSYNPAGKIIINVNHKDYFKNFCHELTHIYIEKPIVQSAELSHQEKEGLVDWILMNGSLFKKLFPEYKYQRISKVPGVILITEVNKLLN